MKGLTKGEQSSSSNPVLQLICRNGGFLADMYAGTYRIEDIKAAGTAPAVVVASASFVPATHKLGTGRYFIPTGATTSWAYGTHRAVCTYTMTNGGPSYTQVIEFEVLDETEWLTGTQYTGYLSTRRAYQDSFVSSSVTRPTLHRLIDEISRQVERWTGRFFDPRYLTYRTEGKASPTLLLPEAIIAVEDVYAIWQTTLGDDSYKYEQYLYKVYNRHLDGYLIDDDRHNPKLDLTDVDGSVVEVSDFAWPYGNQNVEVRGVFGFTDPDADYKAGRVSVGRTPPEIARVVGAMVARYNEDPTLSSLSTLSPGSVRSMKTRDQSITFGGSSGSSSGDSDMSGDPVIDRLLLKFCAPIAFGAV